MADLGIDPQILAAFAQLSADVHVRIDSEGLVAAVEPAAFRSGIPISDAFIPEDLNQVRSLLGAEPIGPVLLRLRTARRDYRWVGVSALPDENGWWLQVRDARRLDPTSARAYGEPSATTAGRDQVLKEVAWLLSATPRTGKEIALVSCQLDGFANVAARHGDDAAEEVLTIVTGRISDSLRSGDLVARLEGDHFLIILRGVHHLRGAIRVANKIRVAVEDPIGLPDGDVVQTASVGVTLISQGEGIDEVMERAEGAMTTAQGAGGNRVASDPPI
jgi:diguanylate cyclase (GGDEF)-like protein